MNDPALSDSRDLVSQFANVSLSESMDQILWRWTSHGQFTVNSLYKWLEFGGVPNNRFNSIWQAKIPLKVKVFLWSNKIGF